MGAVVGLVGGGFRSRVFVHIARRVPDRFTVAGVVVRDPVRGKDYERQERVPTFRSLASLLAAGPLDCLVLTTPPRAHPLYLTEAFEAGLAVLIETPPASTIADLHALWDAVPKTARIQVAEQYLRRPMMAARQAVLATGVLGEAREVDVSISHGYHAVSLARGFLQAGFAPARVGGRRFDTQLVAGPGRDGPPPAERLVPAERDVAWFDFGGKIALYDFTQNQHRSWIRRTRLTVRGPRGEIQDRSVRYLKDYATPIEEPLMRVERGQDENVEGFFLAGVTWGGQWVYRNPFPGVPFNDEEIAVATMLQDMVDYARGGPSRYSLAEAMQDQYLALLMHQAIATGAVVHTDLEPWMVP